MMIIIIFSIKIKMMIKDNQEQEEKITTISEIVFIFLTLLEIFVTDEAILMQIIDLELRVANNAHLDSYKTLME